MTAKMDIFSIPYSGKVWWEECLANLLFSSIWQKKVWRMNRLAKGLLIVTTNLDGFSLVNHRQSANSPNFLPAKLSCYTVYQVSFMCRLYAATLLCWLCVQLTYSLCVLSVQVVLSVV